MSHHLSMSKVDLAECCGWWARSDAPTSDRPSLVSGVLGVNVHEACESHVNRDGAALDLTETEAKMWGQLKAWLDTEPRFTGMELPLLYDASGDTAKLCEMGSNKKRDYVGVSAMTLPGTLDLYRVEEDMVTIVEVKTGAHGNVAKEPENWQLAAQAVAASRYFGVSRARVGAVFTRKTKVRPPSWHTFDADALDVRAGRLHRILKVVQSSEPNRGDWCWRGCPIGPAKGFMSPCPAWAEEQAAE